MNANQPAFPFACQGPTTAPEFYYGLTKREEFAKVFIAGLLANPKVEDSSDGDIVCAGIKMADLALAALEKEATP